MDAAKEFELVEKAKKDIKAFDQLYQYYLPKIYAYCVNRVPNREIAEDITSKVFIDVIENIESFRPRQGARFSSWLYRIAHNKIVDFFRINGNKSFIDISESPTYLEDDHDSQLLKEDLKIKTAQVLSTLKPRYQEIISLRFFSELEIGEIAEILDEKPSNVSVLLHRSIISFKKQFEKKYPESEIFKII